jgi:eukaryotic-like serine/threonine-protein kinase
MTCSQCGSETPGQRGPCALCSPPPPAAHSKEGTLTIRPPGDHDATSPGLESQGASPAGPPQRALGPGAAFGERYTIVEEVGAGGMGRVYKAIDTLSGTSVALKVMSGAVAQPESRQRFQRELALGRAITHQNVCRVHDLGEVERTPYISMEFVEGQTLDNLIRSVGVLSTKQTVGVARQICSALIAIHEGGVVHRDLKPSNIMLDRAGRAIVMDFGMAYQHGEEHLTDAGAVVGTLAYLSPEQSRGEEATPCSDLYALGLIMFEMLTGVRPPGDRGPLPLALRDKSEPCPPPSRFAPEVGRDLDAIVMRCLERDPKRRPTSALQVDGALAALQGGQSAVRLPPAPRRQWREQRRELATLAAAVAVAGVVVWLLWGRIVNPPPPRSTTSLALTPLVYSGPDDRKYLRNVVPLLISDRLRTQRTVPVAPFASSRVFTGGESVEEVADALGVTVVVAGTLQLHGRGGFDLTLHAHRAHQKEPVWTRTVHADEGSVLDHVERLEAELAAALHVPSLRSEPAHPREAVEHYLRARALFDGWDVASNLAQAEAELHAALAADPKFAEAHAVLAQAEFTSYLRDRSDAHLARAEESARKALALEPSLPEAHLALGVVQLARGRTTEAAQTFEDGLDAAPADDALLRNVGRAYLALKRYGPAENMYRRARDLRPQFWSNHNDLGAFYIRTSRLEEAAECFRQVIAYHGNSDTGYSNLAAVRILQGRHKEAEPLLEDALEINPTPETHNNLGLVYYALGRFAEAAQQWRAALEGGAQYPITYSNLGDAYRQLNDRPGSRAAYTRAVAGWKEQLEKEPTDGESRSALAMALAGRQDCPEAKAEARASEARNTAVGSYYLAIAYALCGDDEAATRQAVLAVKGQVVSDVKTNPDLRRLLKQPALAGVLPD